MCVRARREQQRIRIIYIYIYVRGARDRTRAGCIKIVVTTIRRTRSFRGNFLRGGHNGSGESCRDNMRSNGRATRIPSFANTEMFCRSGENATDIGTYLYYGETDGRVRGVPPSTPVAGRKLIKYAPLRYFRTRESRLHEKPTPGPTYIIRDTIKLFTRIRNRTGHFGNTKSIG